MNELFGLSMNIIMYVLLGIFAVCIATVAFIFLTNRVMFNMGVRNLPRRGLQTGLIVLGLMLATLIITAAFATGDTVDYSISSKAYDHWQRTDLNINLRGDASEDAVGPEVYTRETVASDLQQHFRDDPDIERFMPFLYTEAAATSYSTKLSEPSLHLVGADTQALASVGGLRLVDGGRFDLSKLQPAHVLVSQRAADDLGVRTDDLLQIYIRGRQHDAIVAGIVEDEQASGVLGNFDDSTRAGGIVMALPTVQKWTGHQGQVNYISIALKGDVHSTVGPLAGDASVRVGEYINSAEGKSLIGLGDQLIGVETVKSDDVADAEEVGNIFTTFFLIVGLFSIAAGIMLIFMIFVMLAAERKPEMGMARAVGAQRSNLVQSFISEGMSYNLIAGAVGAALGVGAALVLIVGFLRLSLGDEFNFITARVTFRSIVVSYCLGVVLTFITVAIASLMVSSVNIVAAIRGTPEDETPAPRAKVSWRALLIGIPALIIPPVGLWLILRKGLGISWAWILCPAGILLGLFCIMLANSGGSEFLFSFGFSIIPISLGGLAAHYRAPARITWTAVGLFLAAYWLSPWNIGEELLGRERQGDIEMFVVSGIMVVVSFTLIIVFNARLLTLLIQSDGRARYRIPAVAALLTLASVVIGLIIGDRGDGLGQLFYLLAGLLALASAFAFAAVRFPRLAPALKMGVAYPLSNRFRTGMTIAMFSLIIFSLTTFSAVNANFAALTSGSDSAGGWDVVVTGSDNVVVERMKSELSNKHSPAADQVKDIGPVTTFRGQQEVRQTGEPDWAAYPVIAASDAFLSPGTALDSRAAGYADDDAVLEAVRTDPRYALIDTTAIDGFNDYDFSANVTVENEKFEPFEMAVRDAATGSERTVTVIGVWANRAPYKFISGIYINSQSYEAVFGPTIFNRAFVRLANVDSEEGARSIESALATNGVQADSLRKLIDDSSAQDRAFTRMFQGFMALGLFVGIAALGVIAFRSVVERRQQIGMLRAIGYQTESVTLTFILESTFVALMGILSGVVGGAIVSRNLFTTGQFSGEGVDFTMPWSEILVFVVLAFVVSLFMTWWPSRSASRVPVADALRYE
jgi:putative ABC transport system permease protein